jgi:hypothetical protein
MSWCLITWHDRLCIKYVSLSTGFFWWVIISRYSVGLRTGNPGFHTRQGQEILSSSQRPDRPWGPPSLLSNWYRGDFSLEVKRPGRAAYHSTPSSAEVKNIGGIPPFPHTSSWRSV